MLEAISYILLFISIIALYTYDKKHKTYYLVDFALISLWVFSIVFVIYVYSFIGIKNAGSAAPFGIILAALLASTSMMKNIAETKANEVIKHKKDEEKAAKEKERKEAFVLNVVETIHLISASIPTDLVDGDILNIKDNANTQIDAMSRLLDLVFIENVVSYLNREQQIFLAELHRAFYTYKSKPLPQSANAGVLFEAAYLFQAMQEMMKKVNEISERYIITFKKDDV